MNNPRFELKTEINEHGEVEVRILGDIKGCVIPCLAYIVNATSNLLDVELSTLLAAIAAVPTKEKMSIEYINMTDVKQTLQKMRGNGQKEGEKK